MQKTVEAIKTVKCAGCGKSVLRTVAYKSGKKFYCCADCAQGKTCDCQ